MFILHSMPSIPYHFLTMSLHPYDGQITSPVPSVFSGTSTGLELIFCREVSPPWSYEPVGYRGGWCAAWSSPYQHKLGLVTQTVYELVIVILWKIHDFSDPARSQICTCHDSWAVVACAKLWPDWIIISYPTGTTILGKFRLWAHNPFV